MTNWTDEQIKGKILHKLTRLGKFSHSHTSIDNLPKGFPSDIGKRVKDMAKELKKEGILLANQQVMEKKSQLILSTKKRL